MISSSHPDFLHPGGFPGYQVSGTELSWNYLAAPHRGAERASCDRLRPTYLVGGRAAPLSSLAPGPLDGGAPWVPDHLQQDAAAHGDAPTGRQLRAGGKPDALHAPSEEWITYQGRASHLQIGANVPLQVEMWLEGGVTQGLWCMLGVYGDVCEEGIIRDVKAFALRSDQGIHMRFCGSEGADGLWSGGLVYNQEQGGSFQLWRCAAVRRQQTILAIRGARCTAGPQRQVSLSNSSCESHAIAVKGGARPTEGTKEVISSIPQLIEAIASVLELYPRGLYFAKLKSTVHNHTGLWVSEAFLGYRKLIHLIRYLEMGHVCVLKSQGSSTLVVGCRAPRWGNGGRAGAAREAGRRARRAC
ncbi:unnamed protein product [Prorocentrum cordatum]|uniref:HTH OST-type domain-containing protein n=1 Tax=Prorocentrum cordatum TaxID=2364126 RepID=A0ABN9TJD8_9DINO|nr:unnamed protein product [Polarella glacialis]